MTDKEKLTRAVNEFLLILTKGKLVNWYQDEPDDNGSETGVALADFAIELYLTEDGPKITVSSTPPPDVPAFQTLPGGKIRMNVSEELVIDTEPELWSDVEKILLEGQGHYAGPESDA
jgi:hypothetical protein